MFENTTQVCTGEKEQAESRSLALNIARANGYLMHHVHSNPCKTRNIVQCKDKIPLCLPFISDKVSVAIRHSIRRARLSDDVILVDIPSDNIKKRLVRNRLYDRFCISKECIICPYGKVGDCGKVGVIYQLECFECGATYIGETGRALGVRIKEHLANKRRISLNSPLGKHRHEVHGDKDYEVKCLILACETDTSARKTLEAFWISQRNPIMNNRKECLTITNDLMPFIALCEL